MQGGPPVVDHPAYSRVSLKIVYPPDEAECMVWLWERIFKGTISTIKATVCRDGTALAPFTLRQSRKEASDPGVCDITVRACLDVDIGRLCACRELASDGSSTYPDLIVHAMSSRAAPEKQGECPMV